MEKFTPTNLKQELVLTLKDQIGKDRITNKDDAYDFMEKGLFGDALSLIGSLSESDVLESGFILVLKLIAFL
jgi:hypothetical protein